MILVTGGTGLLGAHLIYELLCNETDPIKVLYRKNKDTSLIERIFQQYNPTQASLIHQLQWVKADILDIPALADAMEGVQHMYHCAAKVYFSEKDLSELLKTNVEGTANVVNMALDYGVQKLCYVSSIATFASKEGEVTTENSLQEPPSVAESYALSKYQAEMEVWRGVQEGLPAVVVYPSVIVGIGVEQHRAIPVSQLCKYKYITSGGTGFVGAMDVARAMHLLMKAPILNEKCILNTDNLSYESFFAQLRESHPSLQEKKKLSSSALYTLYLIDKCLSLFGKKRLLSKSLLRTLQHQTSYDGTRVQQLIPFTYTPLQKSLEVLSL